MLTTRGSGWGKTPNGTSSNVTVPILFILLAMWGCTVGKPQVPSTNLTISIPVANDTTTLQDIVDERSEFLGATEDGGIELSFVTEFGEKDRREVGDRLSIAPVPNSYAIPIGDIKLPGQSLPSLSIGADFLSGRKVPSGQAFDIRFEVALFGFQSLTVKEGVLTLSLDNGLPSTLSSLSITLLDPGRGNAAIDGFDIGRLDPGGQVVVTLVLDGKSISSDLLFALSGIVEDAEDSGTEGNPALDISGSLSDLIATEATAIIPPLEFSDHGVLDFQDDRIEVTTATIREGGLTFQVRNDLPLSMEFQIRLDDLVKPDGTACHLSIDRLEPGQNREVSFDLADYLLEPAHPLNLWLSFAGRTFPTNSPVSLSSRGEVRVTAATDSLVFSRVEGRLNRLPLRLNEDSTEVDFPRGLDNIEFDRSTAVMYIKSGIGFRSEMELDILGINKTGTEGLLTIAGTFGRGDPDHPKDMIVVPDSRSLTEFLNLLPAKIKVKPSVFVGDGVASEVIEPHHWVQLDSVVLKSDARFRVKAATQIQPEPIHRELKDERERIDSHLVSALVFITIENHTPLGVRIRLHASSRKGDVYTNPQLTIPRQGDSALEVPPAPVGSDGRVIRSVVNEHFISISGEELRVFTQEGGVFTGVLVEIDATRGDVELRASDFVAVQAATQITVELNESLVE